MDRLTADRFCDATPADERWWAVELYGYDAVYLRAATRDKARWRAFRSWHEAMGGVATFRDFLARGVSVRAVSVHEAAVAFLEVVDA